MNQVIILSNSINKKYIDELLKYIRSDDSLEILVDKIMRSSSFTSLHTYNILKTITHIIMDTKN